MTAALPWLAEALAALDADGLRRSRRVTQSLGEGRICRGAAGASRRTLFDFASNDYLGLAHDPRVIAAAVAALSQAGVGSGASALISGRTPWHAELERTLAAFEQQPAAVLFPTGYAANAGTVAALLGPQDIAFCERLNHACLVEGCRNSGARLRVYRSDRLDRLEQQLAAGAGFLRRWIVTDGVFSMEGTLAPLAQLCELAERFDATLIVDEAHGTGTLGAGGRGAAEQCGVLGRVAVRTGTLSKAVGTLGGFVAGSTDLVDYLWQTARPGMFSTALPPAVCAAATCAVRIIAEEPQRRARLALLSDRLRDQLRTAGLSVRGDPGVPIVPVLLGDAQRAVRIGADLEDRGYAVGVVRPPTVPHNTARLRLTVSAVHEPATIDALAQQVIAALA